MTGTAIALMLVAIVIIWGGLAVSVTALVSRGRREARDARRAAVAAARGALFSPLMENGEPQEAQAIVPIVFELEN